MPMVQEVMPSFLKGGGASAEAILRVDWSRTPLGAIADWPVSLKTAVGMMVASGFPKAIFWGPDYTMLHNDAFRAIMGRKPFAMGLPLREIWSEVWDEVRPIADRAMQGEATFIENFPLVIERGGLPEHAWFTFCYSPIRDENGHIGGFIDTVMETTETILVERALKVQNAELEHRIQNTLAIVSGIARQTLRSANSTEEAWAALSLRLGALAKTHEFLRAGVRAQASIIEVVRAGLQAHGEAHRIHISGPDLQLAEKHALALSLAINELATNALKHGALAVEGGTVSVDWTVNLEDPAQFRLVWQESGGRQVAPPTRRSFGTQLIEQVVPSDFGGSAVLDFAPGGLRYELHCDFARLLL